MKDFDTERRELHAAREAEMGERSFILGGKTFTYRPVVSYTILERISQTNEQEGAELIHTLEQAILDMLEPGQEEAFLAAAHSTEDPIAFADLNAICTWLTEVQVGRPLAPLSPSGSGDETTETPSTDDSSSPLVEASAA